ncbi:MAG: DASS family sodium-coupled anion symporter [Halobacteriovoraceae bacterium]|jgi:solute carrier family 13 (sodium-dependent dicarboxylate transporter), member 2/3/5|nr:DASS family sodium-coupled anion symporter [Halobacteriovoraceae bacterium]
MSSSSPGTSKKIDFLDMGRYKIEKLPKREKSSFETWMAMAGGPLAIFCFIFIYNSDISFLQNIDPSLLGKTALARYKLLGAEAFSQSNIALLAIFAAAIILWISEAVPNYLTSLYLIIAVVLTGVTTETDAYHQLGHKVMWLNILSFVMASMLVKTQVAKRFALWFIVKFGKNATGIFISFIVINLVLSAFISATTAKAAILLPIFMVIAAVYGSTGSKTRNNFGRNLVLQNLYQINISAGAFITGSGANLLAGSMIAGAIGMGDDFPYQQWMNAALPLALINILIAWFIGTKVIFKIPKAETVPQIEGGMLRLQEELDKLGKISITEMKSVILFVAVLLMWVTDTSHGISKTAVAFLGAVIALTPRIGVVKWNDINIPWHLLLFSAGAYTLGAALKTTDLAAISVNALFTSMGFSKETPFSTLYLMLTFGMVFSAVVFQSKTMRALVFVPIAIGAAQNFGYSILALALPVALLIEHVYALPFNSKPAALLYVTDQYSWTDTFKFGMTMLVIGWILIIIWGETWMRFLGITPNGVF